MSIVFQVSSDRRHLRGYYRLRESCFRRELGIADFDGSEEVQDRQGTILLALRGDDCLGGIRIADRITLPSQAEALDLNPERCCMWERFVIDPRVRTTQFMRHFCAHLVAASLAAGFRHAMVLSSLRNARFYRRYHSAIGVNFQIHRQVPHCATGAFSGLEHYLSVAHLREPAGLQMAV